MLKNEILQKLLPVTEEEQKFVDGQKQIDRSIYMDSPLNIVNSKKILRDGKQIAIRPHTRFVHFPEHSHDFVEIIYMCAGQTTHLIDGEKIILKEGELLFLCQSAKQEIYPASYHDIAVNFVILPDFFDEALQMLGEEDTPLKRFIVDCLKNKQTDISYLHFKVSDILPVQNLIENLIWSFMVETSNKRNINQLTMGLLFLQLIHYTDRLYANNVEEKTIVKVLGYIEEQYQNGTLSALAASLGCDVSVLSREIKQKTGKKYTELVQEKRLSQACFLLKNTDIPIDEVAVKIGYENISFFYRIFKKKYGISPKKYRCREN